MRELKRTLAFIGLIFLSWSLVKCSNSSPKCSDSIGQDQLNNILGRQGYTDIIFQNFFKDDEDSGIVECHVIVNAIKDGEHIERKKLNTPSLMMRKIRFM